MEGRREQSMLLDFYGELLTDKQRECFDLHYNEDLSLSEIAEQLGISRQGVWDNIRRAESAMREIEEKTGLIRRFAENRARLKQILTKLEKMEKLAAEREEFRFADMLKDTSEEVRALLKTEG